VPSNSVIVITPGTGSSITSVIIVSTTGAVGGFVGLTFLRATYDDHTQPPEAIKAVERH
jgi:hypothetical protein